MYMEPLLASVWKKITFMKNSKLEIIRGILGYNTRWTVSNEGTICLNDANAAAGAKRSILADWKAENPLLEPYLRALSDFRSIHSKSRCQA